VVKGCFGHLNFCHLELFRI